MAKYIVLILTLPVFLFSQGSLLLMGGGSDTGIEADSAFIWLVQQADSGIIINIDSDPVAESYATTFIERGADPASHSLRITASQANNPSVYEDLITASGIWIEGGAQNEYIDAWKGTLVEDALNYIFQNGGVIGGTSAGAVVLGAIDFSAQYGTYTSDDVIYDPYYNRIVFEENFLNFLPDVLVDSHFHTRGRIGRLVTMIARRITDNGDDSIMGIGVDEQTSLAIDSNGLAKVYGDATVTLIYKDDDSFIHCVDNQPLTFTNIVYHQLTRGAVFDLNQRQLVAPGEYLDVVTEELEPGPWTATTLNGRTEADMQKGSFYFNDLTQNENDAWYGSLTEQSGTGEVPNSVIITHLWDEYIFFQNRYIAGTNIIAGRPGYTAIYLDGRISNPSIYGEAGISDEGVLSVTHGTVYILDTGGMSHSCNLYRRLNGSRRTEYRGMIDARLHFLKTGDEYYLAEHGPVAVTPPENANEQSFILFQNYPNPFNPETVIYYQLAANRKIEISVYNTLGQQVEILTSGIQSAGEHQVTWDASAYAAGIYYYQLKTGQYVQTRKMLLLK